MVLNSVKLVVLFIILNRMFIWVNIVLFTQKNNRKVSKCLTDLNFNIDNNIKWQRLIYYFSN